MSNLPLSSIKVFSDTTPFKVEVQAQTWSELMSRTYNNFQITALTSTYTPAEGRHKAFFILTIAYTYDPF